MIGIMPRLPQTFALGFVGIPSKICTAELFDDIGKDLRLLGDAGFCAMEFYKQGWRLSESKISILVTSFDLHRIEQLDTGNWQAHLNSQHHRLTSILNRWEMTNTTTNTLANTK